ncbi:MAG TPA: glycosyltransferase family 39 protein [Polyangiaceae bacterium]
MTERFRGPRARAVARALLLCSPVAVVWLVFVVSGLRGVDYGFHWDEEPWHLVPVRNAVASGILLPRSYIYPSFDKWLVLWPSLGAALGAGLEQSFDPAAMQAAMVKAVNAPDYLLSARRLFIVVSSLGILWTYGAALAFRMRWWAALVAASGLGLSWEFAYHSRFVATDALLTQFSALVVFMIALFFRNGRVRWLQAASVAAGLATGTKYTGVCLLLPILFASVLIHVVNRPPWEMRLFPEIRRAASFCAIAFVAYLVTTPSTLLDPFLFLTETQWITRVYAGPHGGYTAASAWDHARIVFLFLSLGYFSPYKIVAACAFAGSLVGFGLWVRRDRKVAAVLAIVPILFVTAFCYKFRIVTVRNYMFLAPFLSLFLARAVSDVAERISKPLVSRLLAVPLAVVGVAQAVWLVQAGESIRHLDPRADVREALAYVAHHPETRFRLSGQVLAIAKQEKLAIAQNASSKRNAEQVVFFARAEGPDTRVWQSNDPFQAKAVFGPREVNFDWYSSWSGHDRVVVMTLEKARATKVPFTM